MSNSEIKHIKDKLINFYEDNSTMPDIETRMTNFLFSAIINDLQEKDIKSFGDWLKYYSSDGNSFEDIVSLTESYYFKALKRELNVITMEEKVLIHNAIALYSLEMDIEMPKGNILNTVILTFIEIIRHYNLFLKGYLSLRGKIMISDRSKTEFYTVWSGGSFKKELPINLFSSAKV